MESGSTRVYALVMTTVQTPPTEDRKTWESALARVAARKTDWTRVPDARRVGYLESAMERLLRVAAAWVEEACRKRGVATDAPASGEEWIAGPAVTLRTLRQYVRALRHGGRPPIPGRVREVEGALHVPVFPAELADRILYRGMDAWVRLMPGKPASQGAVYRAKEAGEGGDGGCAVVLGAGNVSSIPPMDVVHKLFVEDEVVVVKMNPVNDYLGPYLEEAFRDLVDDGFLAFTYGGADAGEFLCTDPRVDSLHLTGSDRTYDAIVWGADPEEQARRKAADDPRIDKRFTAELGCVTPVLVVPGAWSEGDLRFQAEHVAGMVAHNASFNCNAAKVLVTARDWPQRSAFLDHVREALRRTPPRRAYYPGARDRYAAFVERYPSAEALGPPGDDVVPWTLIPDVPAREGEYALTREAFCGVLAEVAVDAGDARGYLERAVPLANDVLWGTLSCMVLVDPRTRRRERAAFDRAVLDLRYGGVAVNAWAGLLYGIGNTPWGAFPGHTPKDIRSGTGTVHNGLFLDHPQKAVLTAPFRMWPKPVYFPGHRTLDRLGRNLTTFAANRSPLAFARTLLAGLGA